MLARALWPPRPPAAGEWRGLLGGLASASAAALSMAWLWGFTVDDALITCRVAWHLSRGLGYRFNPAGPVVDAVTPLGFAHLLACFASGGPEQALQAAKWLGATGVGLAVFWLGHRTVKRTSIAYATGLISCLAVTAPLAAWAVSGMETGLVTALAVGALGNGVLADLSAAAAAALRPELAPWCVCVRFGVSRVSLPSFAPALRSAAIVLGAVILVAALRASLFGRAAPLAVFAKPSDLAHGARYALFAFVQTGLPLLCLAPASLVRQSAPLSRVVTLAGLVHFATLALVGGDWMSLYRLAVPILPSYVLGAAELWRVAPAWASWLRLACAGCMSAYLASALGPTARQVGPERQRLIVQARTPLAGAKTVAALDVGWLGAVGDFAIVDLAGVTDVSIAMLPGGHTSKRVEDALLRNREVDALVLLSARSPHTGYAREVERRLALTPTAAEFREVARLALGGGSQSYVILRRLGR